jgi:hypothetical protein
MGMRVYILVRVALLAKMTSTALKLTAAEVGTTQLRCVRVAVSPVLKGKSVPIVPAFNALNHLALLVLVKAALVI